MDQPQILLSDHQIAIVIPIMASRFQHMVATYRQWRNSGFAIVLVFNKVEEKEILSIIQQQAPDMRNSFVLHPYMSHPSNAGIAKKAAYEFILQNYLNDLSIQFALLLDDTVNDIINTYTEKSIMINPTKFFNTVLRFAEESPVFGGTVAHKRHPEKCKQDGVARVEGGFLQQAIIFSCRGSPILTKHFESAEEYMTKMRRLSYRSVPFGEDVSFQIALYELGVLHKDKSAQFWGLGILRIKHKSATKRVFEKLDGEAKEALKDMIIYLKEQGALIINPHTEALSGVKVMPGGCIRIHIRGIEGERPWKQAYEYAFPR